MAHSEGMFEMWRQAEVQKYSGPAQDAQGNPIRLPAECRADSDKLIQFWIQTAADGWGFTWALVLKESGVFVGHIGFNSLTECSEIAYHMNPGCWGQGLMSEAASAAVAWRKGDGGSEVEAYIEPENTGSLALALRLGMNATDTFSDGAQRYRMTLT